ncbi:hypothetical protein TorRG33x02_042390 [Trema orientale]|uniref:Uncharacterized protein n=1 Tax=Trema orientale TaxID=63057 RepID=A0A2P5FPT9_TREOI|nr:hypothetical protein TorRG33x02_042390 [Trema orientale]
MAARCLPSRINGSLCDPGAAIWPGNTPWTIFSSAKAKRARFEEKWRGLGMPVKVVLDSMMTNLVTCGSSSCHRMSSMSSSLLKMMASKIRRGWGRRDQLWRRQRWSIDTFSA